MLLKAMQSSLSCSTIPIQLCCLLYPANSCKSPCEFSLTLNNYKDFMCSILKRTKIVFVRSQPEVMGMTINNFKSGF